MIRSLRFSLTLWYVGILTVILCLFGFMLYTNVAANLYRDIDRLLVSEADGVGEAIFSFLKEKKFDSEIQNGKLSAIIEEWAEETDELQQAVRPMRLMAPDGTTLAFSSTMAQWRIPLTPATQAKIQGKRTAFETFQTGKSRVRLISRPIMAKGRRLLYFVQVATSLHQADQSLKRLRLWLFWLVPLTAVVTSLVGWFLASLALKPVDKMTAQAKRIRESRLHERIDIPKTGDELERLALTFNEMLSRLERGFRRLRQFSAAASHELRTPLTVMRGEMEWILRKPRHEDEYERVLRTQLEMINEMTQIVEQLLAVAHADEGEWAVDWQPVDLVKLVNGLRDVYQARIQNKKVTIAVSAPEAVWVQGEKSLLERLVTNLLENALKHTPPPGKVRIAVTRQGPEAQLVVEDTGKGIEEKDLSKVFDKFFTRWSGNDGTNSTGIGLGLCRWIAEAHQGKIEVASPSGRGAVFTVSLPLFKDEPAPVIEK